MSLSRRGFIGGLAAALAAPAIVRAESLMPVRNRLIPHIYYVSWWQADVLPDGSSGEWERKIAKTDSLDNFRLPIDLTEMPNGVFIDYLQAEAPHGLRFDYDLSALGPSGA